MNNPNQYKSGAHKLPDPISLYNTPGNMYVASSPSEDLDDEDYPDDYILSNNNNNINKSYQQKQQGGGGGMYHQFQHQSITSPHSPAIHTSQAFQQQLYGPYIQLQHPHFSSSSPSSPSTSLNSPLPFAKKPDCMFYVKVNNII